jgi:hypothetical protein
MLLLFFPAKTVPTIFFTPPQATHYLLCFEIRLLVPKIQTNLN